MPTPCHLIGLEKYKPATPITTGLTAYGFGLPPGCTVTGLGVVLEAARHARPLGEALSGLAYLRHLAGHRRRVRRELARLAAERRVGPAPKKLNVPRIAGRPWDTLRVCNCAGCGARLLGESDEALRQTVRRKKTLARLPPPVAARVNGRPLCGGCVPTAA